MLRAVRYVAVSGPGRATAEETATARELGRGIAEAGAIVLTGGLGGVMEAAAAGAAQAGGTAIGLLPGHTRDGAGPSHTFTIPTGLGELRNGLLVRAAELVIACGGSWGTLSEIALAARTGRPVITLGGWDLEALGAGPVRAAADAAAALDLARELLGLEPPGRAR
jgi:uncharacterized protein (TIGR00725 family)